MELLVKIVSSDKSAPTTEYRVAGFGDLAKIGTALARPILQFLRSVPVRPQGSRRVFTVTAQWAEPKQDNAPRGQLLRLKSKARKRVAH
jgi:hypothetical protein